MSANIDLIVQYIIQTSPALVAFTETWLNVDDTIIPAELKSLGFNLIQKVRADGRKGGGVLLLIRNGLITTPHKYISSINCEILYTKVIFNSITLPILLIYRPPNNSPSQFLDDFSRAVNSYLNDNLIVLGDFNFHYDCDEGIHAKFKNVCKLLQLKQHVDFSTHLHGHTIDLILTHKHSNILLHKPYRRTTVLTDHYTIECKINIAHNTHKTASHTYRCINKIVKNTFIEDFKNASVNKNLTPLQLDATLTNLLDNHAPLKTGIFTDHHTTPWFNCELGKLKRSVKLANKKFKRNPTPSLLNSLKKLRKTYRTELRLTKIKYYSNKISQFPNDFKKMYDTTNKLLGKVKGTISPNIPDNTLCEKFVSFYRNKLDSMNASLHRLLRDTNTEPHTYDSLTAPDFDTTTPFLSDFNLPTLTEIQQLILTANSTSPTDPLPLLLTKSLHEFLSPIYRNIIINSLQTGLIPDELKHTIITPILKKPKLDPTDLLNFRPIAQLPLLSKITEKIVLRQLTEYVMTYNLLDNYQNGFRKNHSTETTLNSLFDYLYSALDNHRSIQLILLDLSSAFDTINHNKLQERLGKIGIRGTALSWLTDFFSARSAAIRVNNSYSKHFELGQGVPQGSSLSPLLFSLYLTPLTTIFNKYPTVSYNLYADDIELHTTVNNSTDLQNCITELQTWLTKNSLLLNTSKTELLNITKFHNPIPTFPDITINNIRITPSESITYLGLTFNNRLNFDEHLTKLQRTTSALIFNIRKLRPYLTLKTTKLITDTLVLSRLKYCDSLFNGLNNNKLHDLDKLTNRSIRIIYKLPITDYKTSITELKRNLNWLNTEKNTKHKILTILYKVITSNEPYNLRQLIQIHRPTRPTRSSNYNLLSLPHSLPGRYGYRKFSYLAAIYWNELPPNLQHTNLSYTAFSKKLKCYLLNS